MFGLFKRTGKAVNNQTPSALLAKNLAVLAAPEPEEQQQEGRSSLTPEYAAYHSACEAALKNISAILYENPTLATDLQTAHGDIRKGIKKLVRIEA